MPLPLSTEDRPGGAQAVPLLDFSLLPPAPPAAFTPVSTGRSSSDDGDRPHPGTLPPAKSAAPVGIRGLLSSRSTFERAAGFWEKRRMKRSTSPQARCKAQLAVSLDAPAGVGAAAKFQR